jgi:ribosomal protein S18 acetylase RimI-like enzyme
VPVTVGCMSIGPTPAHPDLRVRQAASSDIDALSRLLVQLYAFELPGMLRGDAAAQTEIARRLITATPLRGRSVVVRDGAVVATGSFATRDAPRPSTPPGALLALPSVMGARDALKSFVGVLRGMLTIAAPPAADEAQIHSVVVDDRARGQGAGSRIMQYLEREAAASGKRRIVLQVVASNAGARAFYRALGYEERGPAHGHIRNAIAFPSVLMYKDIQPGR